MRALIAAVGSVLWPPRAGSPLARLDARTLRDLGLTPAQAAALDRGAPAGAAERAAYCPPPRLWT